MPQNKNKEHWHHCIFTFSPITGCILGSKTNVSDITTFCQDPERDPQVNQHPTGKCAKSRF